ncbi:MAG: hypothetical protein PHF86_00015 [Candidatus Nanoarchaeia archaeon]|nr:hypothetical protein [Candidatus Nanoarchaeia archaeon]
MNFEKQIWKLFKLNKNDFNKYDKQIEKILFEVYEQGKKDGKKEQIKLIQIYLKNILTNKKQL